jgi:hypothetical protein
MYSPKIREDLIPQIHQWAQRLGMPMTRLVNALLAHALVRLEQGVEQVSALPAAHHPSKKRKQPRARYDQPARPKGG